MQSVFEHFELLCIKMISGSSRIIFETHFGSGKQPSKHIPVQSNNRNTRNYV